MAIPREYKEFFDHVLNAGAAGRLALVEGTDNATGAEVVVLTIYADAEGGGYELLPFALFDPAIANGVTPHAELREVTDE